MSTNDEAEAVAFLRRKIAEDGPPRKTCLGEQSISSSISWPSEDVLRYLSISDRNYEARFRRTIAHDIFQILYRCMANSRAPLADRSMAARLFQNGAQRGWWDIAPEDATLMKDILCTGRRAPRVRIETDTRSENTITRPRKSRKIDPKLERALRLMEAHHEFETAMRDRSANKITVIARLFDTMEREGMGEFVRDVCSDAAEKLED